VKETVAPEAYWRLTTFGRVRMCMISGRLANDPVCVGESAIPGCHRHHYRSHTRISRKAHARALLLRSRYLGSHPRWVLPASWCNLRQLCPNKLNEKFVWNVPLFPTHTSSGGSPFLALYGHCLSYAQSKQRVASPASRGFPDLRKCCKPPNDETRTGVSGESQ
jgi:hypothetical protein